MNLSGGRLLLRQGLRSQPECNEGQISATTFIFFMILSLVVAGYVIRTFLVPAVTSFEQGTLVKSVANVKDAYTAVCDGHSVGAQVSISVPAKGVFLVIDCPTLLDVVTEISPINGAGKLPDATVADLKGKCPSTKTCDDGTQIGKCSATKPRWCNSAGSLIDSPKTCGCPEGQVYNEYSAKCVTSTATTPVPDVFCSLLPDGATCSGGTCKGGKCVTPIPTAAPTKTPTPAGTALQSKTVLLTYGWDKSWDWWFVHKQNIEIKSELIGCSKPVHAWQSLGNGQYQRQLRLERDEEGNELVRMTLDFDTLPPA